MLQTIEKIKSEFAQSRISNTTDEILRQPFGDDTDMFSMMRKAMKKFLLKPISITLQTLGVQNNDLSLRVKVSDEEIELGMNYIPSHQRETILNQRFCKAMDRLEKTLTAQKNKVDAARNKFLKRSRANGHS